MALEREALTHKIEDDLALRNRNWNQLDSHLAESANKHIKEIGSNANGRYIRFDDGTQICMTVKNISTADFTDQDETLGAVYRSRFPSQPYPKAFVEVFYSDFKVYGSTIGVFRSYVIGTKLMIGLTSDNIQTSLWHNPGIIHAVSSGGASGTITCGFFAVGRWK